MGLCPLVGGQRMSVLVLVRAIVYYLLLYLRLSLLVQLQKMKMNGCISVLAFLGKMASGLTRTITSLEDTKKVTTNLIKGGTPYSPIVHSPQRAGDQNVCC
jgi:hypothetical protein